MGLLKNAERRSPSRTVSEPDEGVEAPVEGVAAHPEGAVETGVLDSLSAGTRWRPRGGRRVNQGRRAAPAASDVPDQQDEPHDDGVPRSQQSETQEAESS